ncbi:alpha-ketoglutarate-dependent dioxygenase AlkB family protein [Flavobacterium yafengii]|uniref:Alpha-ketoglutarate-dependent dioxygenase AlkB n=1 Tax=Flavobacterium yafengii TaxID=3041253 RepID=A0AAW6TM13_9FLAO|nr:alpha-ketoglutarate-dependent dioxygenase AlkB [Flavobacterium yafengii]MDI5950637.1 alpha-ketoglutarate-dependent dioxygenase AlkB [Flavobacterium yafengii]
MKSLFESTSEPIFLDLPDAEIIYYPQFFDKEQADIIFAELVKEIPWQQDEIRVYGKIHPQPRLTALFGNEGKPYSYSNITMQPHAWNLLLQKLKTEIEKVTDTNFTTVLLNYYRDGKDSNGWHADNEKELGINPVIASLSFGVERTFQLKHNLDKDLKKSIVLQHGSLLIMKGTTQHFWKHQIPKTAKPIGPRINGTFRIIK